MEYEIQLSEYGTVAHRADIVIEANSEREAIRIAEQMAQDGEVEFDDNEDAIDGWEYQVENIQKA